jgi:hypothetical protein
MLSINHRYSTLLALWSSIVVSGCQTTQLVDEQPKQIPRSEWVTLNLGYPRDANGFPGRVFIGSIDNQSMDRNEFGTVAVRGMFRCERSNMCTVHPGMHSIELVYVWSKTETVRQQKKRRFWTEVTAPIFLIGGMPGYGYGADQNSRCRTAIEFDAEETKNYALNVIHSNGTGQPDSFQLINTDTGAVLEKQDGCEPVYETALPYSHKRASADQCAIHLMSTSSTPKTFYINDSHPIHGYEMNHTVFVEPGDQLIGASFGSVPTSAKSADAESVFVQCGAGEEVYVRFAKASGFWNPRFKLTELSTEDAQRIYEAVMK